MSKKRIQIVADENMPALPACFTSVADVSTKAGRDIRAQDLKVCDALLVRSITQVNAALLNQSCVQFVGSATIGTDHIDQNYLRQQDITFTHAPGSNAQSVVEYVITAIALWCQKQSKSPEDLSIGIIGKGQIGSRLFGFLNELGVTVHCCDAPLERAGQPGPWSPMSTIQNCDVITCHVPLTETGQDATYHLIDDAFMSGMKFDSLLINSSRGPVVDNQALLNHLSEKKFEAVLDVWETEPVIDLNLMDRVFLSTPHIAGYAYEAKIRGTFMLYQAFCRQFNFEEKVRFVDLLPQGKPLLSFKDSHEWVLKVTELYDIKADDERMRVSIKNDAQSFDSLRKNYPQRREFLQL